MLYGGAVGKMILEDISMGLSEEAMRALAVTSIDGRYAKKVESLAPIVSEKGLIESRIHVESQWLLYLDEVLAESGPRLSSAVTGVLKDLQAGISLEDALEVKKIEARTNHDVKAVEYFIKQKLQAHGAEDHTLAFIHFACTSEDINNLAYGLMLDRARNEVMIPAIDSILGNLIEKIEAYSDLSMLSRTHGQTASPTTLGKELAVFAHRIYRYRQQLVQLPLEGKMNGAVGNYNAHLVAFAEKDWHALTREFVEARLGLRHNPITTQIENHDSMVDFVSALNRIHTILIGLSRDIWSYISINYFGQKTVAGEVGSSTMPHKVNPIDFENAEGNLGVASGIAEHFAAKLPISRWQRDLSDSTVQRVMGTYLGHSLLGLSSLLKGLKKIHPKVEVITADLEAAAEVLAEPIQTVMRRYGISDAYEKLKAETRGQSVSRDSLVKVIDACQELPEVEKLRLKELTAKAYTGSAKDLAMSVVANLRSGGLG